MNIPHSVTASVLVLILYLFAGVAVRQRWNHRIALNPLKIVAGASGRASLSNAQVFFFTLIVAWLALYWVIREGELIPINDTVLALLGIAVVGSAAGKATAISKFRVTGQNWAWSKKKGWIKESFNRSAVGQTPKPSDLITSDQGFEIAKFQAVVFSLIVGISLLVTGATATSPGAFSGFEVKDAYLALIGLSQGVYVGGKAIGSNLIAELNKKLDDVRKLETEFTSAVANSATWKGLAKADRTMKAASEQAKPTEYVAYMSAATEAAEIVGHVTGIPVAASSVEPELPVTL
jgi:hypothetical protein